MNPPLPLFTPNLARTFAALALLVTAGAVGVAMHRDAPSVVVADISRAAWQKPEPANLRPPAPAEEVRCNEPTEPDLTVKQEPPAVPVQARVRADPMTGDTTKRAPVAKGCACAALDPACACLPLASPCPVPGAAADGPCRYF